MIDLAVLNIFVDVPCSAYAQIVELEILTSIENSFFPLACLSRCVVENSNVTIWSLAVPKGDS